MKFVKIIILLTIIIDVCDSLYYDDHSHVVQLTTDNYFGALNNDFDVWIINFYSPTLKQSIDIIPHYIHLARIFFGVINVAAFNCNITHYICKQLGINSLPMIKFYGIETNYTDYFGPPLLGDLIQACSFAVTRRFFYKLDQKPKKFKQNIVQLTDEVFDTYILHSDKAWVIEYYELNSGPLKNFLPQYEKIAQKVRKIGIMCALIDGETSIKKHLFNVKTLPTFHYFHTGIKSRHSVETYTGPLDHSLILKWILDLYNKSIPIPTIHQMIDETTARKACTETIACIFIIIPTIKQCNSTCRHEYLNILHDVADKLKKNNWGWLWSVIGTQNECEQIFSLDLNMKIPEIFIIDYRERLYWTDKFEPFTVGTVLKFLLDHDMDQSIEYDLKVNELPTIHTQQIWDGVNEVNETEKIYEKNEL